MSEVRVISGTMSTGDTATRSPKNTTVDEDRIAASISTEWELPEWLHKACEVSYIESNNTLLFRCEDGSLVVADANLESTAPLAVAKYSPRAQVLYDKQNGMIIFLNERSLCFRREYSGLFLIKEALTVQDKNIIRLEMPADEAAKLVQTAAASDEAIVLRRPALAAFITKLSSLVGSIENTSHESVVVEVDGAELLGELRPAEGVAEGQPEVPVEWTAPVWHHVAALAERIRLLLNPEHPYNFEYAPEWKGIDKEVMVSEAARRLTFEHWPHMNYRWALPCQMAEAGFFHQPNKAGDDRVLCFACLVCLVCWEPSDEPWSEHERHSQSCRFIRNNANPNVPLALTMSSLSPIAHHMRSRGASSFIVSATSNCEWIAIAFEASTRIHLWRSDRVVHANQFFTVDVTDSFIAMKTGYALTEVPRRSQRVTWSDWSDDAVESSSRQAASTEGVPAATTGQPWLLSNSSASTSDVNIETQNSPPQSTVAANVDELLITAICTVGNPCMIEQSSIGAVAGSTAARCHPTIVVGIALDSSKLIRSDRQHGGSAEVCALNSVNSVCGADATPRIVAEEASGSAEQTKAPAYHPFVVVYQITEHGVVCADSSIAGGRSDDTKDEEMWCVQPTAAWISTAPSEKPPPASDGTKVPKSNNGAYMSKMASLEETDFAEAMMLIESENDAPEWSASAAESEYEHPCDQSMLDEDWETESKSTSKFEEKASNDFISINYGPAPVSVVLLQCFRLPPEIDESSMKVKAIIPSGNGMNLVVAVSREAGSSGLVQSAVVVYRLIFTQYVTSVQEQPCKTYYDTQHCIEQMLVVSADALASPAGGTQSELSMPAELLENVIIRTTEGEVWMIDVNKNERVKICDDKAKHIALMDSGKCAVLTETGKLLVLQVEQMCCRRIVEDEDEEATVAALLSGILSTTTAISPSSSTISNATEGSSSVDGSSLHPSRMQIYAMQPLTCGNLRKLWELTRSDGGASLLTASPGTLSFGVAGFQVVPPLGWSEIQLHQKCRKNPQHWLRGDRSTRSWHLQADAHGLPNVQAFEVHLQAGIQISHANVRFTFHSSCVGCPDVQVTVLRRRAIAPSDSSKDVRTAGSGVVRPATTFKIDIDDLREQCDIVAGPLLLADYVDVGGASSIVQLPGRIFLSTSHHPQVGNKAAKMQTFYLLLESLSDVSFEQLIAAHKIRDKEKAAAQDANAKTKSWRRRDATGGEKKTSESKFIKKSHSKADLPPTGNTRGSGAPYAAPHLSASSLQSRKGIEWIEEISITLLKAKRGPERHERIQRRMMLETYDFHRRLVKLAAGTLRECGDPHQLQTNGVRLLNEHRALDLIMWLLDNWSVSSSVQYILGVGSVVVCEMENLLANGFIFASRSIAHKWCSLLVHLLHLLKPVDTERHCELLEAIMKSLTASIGRLYLVENAGALHWLLTLAFATLQMCTSLAGNPKCSGMVDSLLMACANTLTVIGKAWNKHWNESVHEKLASSYGLCGLPLELVMYEWPSPMLSLWTRSSMTNNCLVPMGTSVAVMPMPIAINGTSNVKYPWSSPGAPTTHFTAKHAGAGATISGSSLSKSAQPSSAKDVVAVSAFMNSATAQDEIDWLDVFNIVLGDTDDVYENAANDDIAASAVVPPPGTSYALNSRFGASVSESGAGHDVKRRAFLSPSQLSGLLEVEPLTFTCCAASEHVKVENLDTGTIATISSSNTPVVHMASKGAMIVKAANAPDLPQPTAPSAPALETDLDTFLKVNLHSLSARMKKIAMEVNDQCSKDRNTSSDTGMHVASADTTQGSATQGSSASTFGVPTTPKTTPFMTPTPLSPSHLSPINSETNLTILPEEDRVDEPRSGEMTGEGVLSEQTRAANVALTPAITVVPCDLLKPPPIQVLSIERMAAGARKFVVLDFGVPVLLTDVLIPSCAELFSLLVDVWLLGESVDGQRLISSAQIANKSIALQDITPTMLIRFVKLTYVGRQLFNAPCRVPIGSFFGHRFFSAWQPYACPHMVGQLTSYPSLPHPYQQPPPVSIEHLRQLCEDLRCRHQLASNELVNLVEEEADELEVKMVYKECTQLRAQWNVVRGVVKRLQFDQAPVQERNVVEGSWWKCGPEQLRVVAEQLFALLTQSVHLLDLRSAAAHCTMMAVDPDLAPAWMELACVSPTVEEVNAHHLLSLEMAVQHFTLFCATAMPKLQVDCAVWLFHHGAEMPWWPQFFPMVLTELFSSPMKKDDEKVFMLLSFLCNHTVKSASSQASVMLELLQFIDGILKKSSAEATESGPGGERPTLQTALLCCSILLTSTAFDVILGGKRKMDRWAFAAGEFAFGAAYTSSSSTSSSMPAERLGDYCSKFQKKTSPLAAIGLSSVADMDVGATAPTAAELHSKVQSLWGQHLQHLQAMEAMKASIKGMSKTVKAIDDKIQKKCDMKMKPSFFDKASIEGGDSATSSSAAFPEAQSQVLCDKASNKAKGSRASDMTVRQVQERFEKKLEEIHYKQTPEVTSEKIEELVKWAGKSSSLSPLKARSNRPRQYNIRLKLPLDVCESVASGLIRTLCEHTDQIPSGGKLLLCKMVARICTNASHHTIPLAAVLGEHLEQLIQIGLNSRNAVVMRSAVLSLLEDVIEAEARGHAKITAGSRMDSTLSVPSSVFEGIIASSVDQFCQKLTGIEYATLAEQALQRSTSAKNFGERKSTGATAAASALPFAFAFMKTSRNFSVANYDTAPSQDGELDTLIDQAMSLIGPVELSSCAVGISTRSIILRYLCREVIISRLEKGEPFSNMFRWIDGVRYGEARVAAAADNVVAYAVKLCSPSLPRDAFPVTDDKHKTSISALIACLRTEHAIYNDSAKVKAEPSESPTTAAASGGSTSPSASTSPTIHEGEQGNLDELVVNYEMIYADDLQTIKVLDTFADNMSGDITKDAAAVFISCDRQEELSSDRPEEDSSAQAEDASITSSPVSEKKSKAECSSERELLMSLPKEKASKQMLLDHIMISFLMQARSISEEVMVQPCSINLDERAECQLGLRAYIRCLAVDSLADILLRHSRRHLAPWRKRPVSRPRAPESESLRAQMGRTLPNAICAISKLIKEIPTDASVDYVIALLSFFNDFQEGVTFPEVVRRMMGEMHLVFPTEGIDAVLAFAAACERPTEQLWTLIIRFLFGVIRGDDAAGKHLILAPQFSVVLSRFITNSVNRFSESTTVGPAMTSAFGDLVHRLHATPIKDTFAAALVTIVSDVFLRKEGFEFLPYPVEMIMQIVMTMRRQPETYAHLPSQKLSKFLWAVIRVTKDLLHSDKFVRNEPIPLMDCNNRAELCFQSVKLDLDDATICEKDSVDKNSDSAPAESTGATDNADFLKNYWSVSQLPLARLDIYESSSQLRYYEEMVGTLLQEVLGYCVDNKTLVADVIREFPAAVEDLLEVLSSCSFCDRDYDSLFEERRFLNCWKPVSVADYALRLLLLFFDLADDQLEHMIGLTVECLKRCVAIYAPPAMPKLSKPVTFAVIYMLLIPQNQRVFIEFGGHLVVSSEIKNCIATSMGDWTAPEGGTVVRQLASMASQVSFAGEYPVAPRRPPVVRVEGLFNYAPICSIASSSSMAHQLSTLLAAAPPHRRARTANWSYHFYPGEEWLDLILTLPYQIMLYEVHIRPHPPTLNTGPSAVQLEVSSDPTFSTWTLLAPKTCTLGFSKIRIPAYSFPYPVSAIRIYLRRAPDSTNLGLSQILVLGASTLQALSVPPSVSSDFRQWLAILDRLCTMEETSIWQYAPDLPRCIVALFLGRPLQRSTYERVSSLLVRIDNAKAKPNTVVELILNYTAQARYVAPKSLEYLPEVIFTLCSKAAEGTRTPLHVKHQIQVFRQRQLLTGIDFMLSSSHSFPYNQQEAIAVLIWSASCAVWKNVSDKSMHFDTVAVCVEVGTKLIPRLCDVASNLNSQWRNSMSEAASWLLCSLIRCAPTHLCDALRFLGFGDAPERSVIPSSEAMSVVGRMCQSATAVRSLLSTSTLQHWIEYAIMLCEGADEVRMTTLASIVECLRALCSIEEVVDYLDGPCGSALFKPLITFVAHSAATRLILSSSKSRSTNLENATVGLICRCISIGRGHRERISSILCSLLKNERTLNGAVQQMVLKCVLDDETISVKLIDEKIPPFLLNFFDFKGRMIHPLFGCSRREHVATVSMYAAFRDLLPPCVLSANIERRSASKSGHGTVEQDRPAVGVDYDVQAKSVNGNEPVMKGMDSKKLIVTYLICDAYSKRRPVSGDWCLGQFIDALRSVHLFGRSVAWGAGEEPSAVSEADHGTAANFTDGYFTLLLKISSSTVDEVKRAVEDELPPFEVPSSTPQHISTLQHFARAGGLAILAQHLQLYQPSSSINTTTISPRGPSLPKESLLGGWLQNYVMQPLMAEPNGYIPVYFPVPDVAGEGASSSMTGFGVAVPSTFPDDNSLTYDHDFEFIDMPQSNMSFDFVQKFYPPLANHPSYATVMPNAQKGPTSRVSDSSSYSLSTALSPHVVIAFSVLLRLDGYAELLVTYDRVRSKRLLHLAMGVSISEQSTLIKPTATSLQAKGASEETGSDNDTLALLPFIVLERLFRTQHPDTPTGRSLRNAAIKYGVLDILLVCLAHYSHQQHKAEPIRPESLLPAPESVKLTEHLLRASAQIEALRAEAANNASANGYDDRMAANYSSAVCSTTQGQQQSFWAKGTGFGSGTTQQQWNVDAHVMKRKLDEETVTHLLRVLASYIFPSPNWRRGRCSRSRRSTTTSESSSAVDCCSLSWGNLSSVSASLSLPTGEVICDEWLLDGPIVELFERSCLLPTICAYLRNDSVLDISRHVEVYEAVVHLVAALARCPAKQNDDGRDTLAALLSQCDSGVSLLTMLKKLHGYILAYLSKLYTDNTSQRAEPIGGKGTEEPPGTPVGGTTARGSEEGLTRLSHIIMRTCTFVSRRVGGDSTKTESSAKPILTADEKYIEIMRTLQFQSIPFFSDTGRIPYHYESSLGAVGLTATLGKRTRRLAQEVVTLSNSLPLTASSSVFVRCAEERLDVMKVLITGPSDTPYMNGCFEFDVWFPTDYPNSPMHVNLETTGNHTVRFNPNLYNDGKVCLSVLNTWHGRPEERWNPETSSFLQVIVSMQSLILVSEPYFNEPGYERSKCTQAGQQASRDYDANIRQATVRWAMLEMIRHPPVAFRDVVMRHFWLKRDEIISQITEWIRETEVQIEEQRGTARTLQAHLASLKRHFTALQEEFARMERPTGLEEDGARVAQSATANANGTGGGGSSVSSAMRQLPVQTARLSTMKVLKL